MYQEDNHINYVRIIVRVVIFFLILLLVMKLISLVISNNNNKNKDSIFQSNLDSIANINKTYYLNNLPENIGDYKKDSLKTLNDNGMNITVNDSNGNSCDLNASYISIYNLDNEYRLESFLSCDGASDSKIIYLNKETLQEETNESTTTTESISPETTSTTSASTAAKTTSTSTKTSKTTSTTTAKNNATKTKKTTKKTTTTSKNKSKTNTTKIATTSKITTNIANNITISFNSNGGNAINSISISRGSKVSLPVPTRNGYTFAGWYYHNMKITDTSKLTSNIVLTAKWSK